VLNKKLVLLLIVFFTIALSYNCPVFAGSPDIDEGSWDIAISMSMQGTQMPPRTHIKCIKKKDLMPFDSNSESGKTDQECKPKNVETIGNKVTWTMDCEGMTGNGEINYYGDTFKGKIIINTADGEMVQHLQGKRTGPCKE
jgi:hypothetical protein